MSVSALEGGIFAGKKSFRWAGCGGPKSSVQGLVSNPMKHSQHVKWKNFFVEILEREGKHELLRCYFALLFLKKNYIFCCSWIIHF